MRSNITNITNIMRKVEVICVEINLTMRKVGETNLTMKKVEGRNFTIDHEHLLAVILALHIVLTLPLLFIILRVLMDLLLFILHDHMGHALRRDLRQIFPTRCTKPTALLSSSR